MYEGGQISLRDLDYLAEWLHMGFMHHKFGEDTVNGLLTIASVLDIPKLGRDYRECSLWMNANTFDDQLDLNKRYLRSELEMTPYHVGPLPDEWQPLTPQLLEMADLGLFTHDVGIFEYIRGQREESDPAECFEARQIPRVSFLISGKESGKRLYSRLKELSSISVRAIHVTQFEYFPGSAAEILTAYVREAETYDRLHTAEWEKEAMCPLQLRRNDSLYDFECPVQLQIDDPLYDFEALSIDTVAFEVAASEWTDMDVLQLVIDTARASREMSG